MPAIKRKRLILTLALILVLTAILCYPSFSKEKDKEGGVTTWGHIMFSSEGGSHAFFDSSSGNIYEYSSTSGRLRHIWALEELGKDLTQIK